eukprot:TRINITY_DN802_c0_g1_i2.p2 TRINITY_DN802_c0_g1~~TRINITY_DN802_c0_g1_i2.p2  ORF type:complete len:181 (-),score=23.27 TRINITY_DN802_c0_g1_i2:167-709(-)
MNTCPSIYKQYPLATIWPKTFPALNRSSKKIQQVSFKCRAVSGMQQQQPKNQIGGGGGSEGSPPFDNNSKLTDEGDDDKNGTEQVEAILAKEGVELHQLPKELQQALIGGIVGAKDVNQWLAVASTPIIGWICQIWPGFRERVLGNPRFLLALAIEEVIGCSAKYSAEIKSRVWQRQREF